jgi:deoxyribose-phosphate aldolase
MIDHAVLAPDATRDDVLAGCELAAELETASICIHPRWVETAVKALKGSPVIVGTVAGFPLGATTSEVKSYEARQAVSRGADEIDMVLAITSLKSGEYDAVLSDIAAVVGSAYAANLEEPKVKVILETCYLTEAEICTAVALAVEAGADLVKTSTGLGPEGATVENVRLLRECAPDSVGVKAAGGIRTVEDCAAMIDAGATRIGTSSTAKIAEELGIR